MHQTQDRTRRARRLRVEMTGPEMALWAVLRAQNAHGFKFRRQTPVAGYVVDFACLELKLILELDGGVHRLTEVEDTCRDARIAEAGFTVLRFTNNAFLNNPAVVLDAISKHAARIEHPPHPSGSAAHLLPQGEKGEEEA